jgi:Flp pilus assembly protein TadG
MPDTKPSRIQVSKLRLKRSSGNLMVEAMLVMLPTFALLSGFFDVTFALFDWTTLQNAVREGVRYAVTFQTASGMGQDASIAQTVVTNSMGLLSSSTAVDSNSSGQLSITVNYYTQQNPNTVIPAPGGNAPNNIVEVTVVNYNLQWMVPIAGTIINPFRNQAPATINLYARDILGGLPAGVNSVNR